MIDRSNNSTNYGPDNPHPLSRMRTELVWEGKYDEYGNRRPVKLPTSALPLQRIEAIDEPRDRAKAAQLGLFDDAAFRQKAHRDDFRNMLIWGDNKLALASLLEQFRGKVDLIYIDPPFDVGADFTMQVQLGYEGETLEKEQSILEAVAYRDMWGRGTDSYLHMMYERLMLMRDLLSERGSIYVHCDYRVNSYLRLILGDVFGEELIRNEIVWQRTNAHNETGQYGRVHDTIYFCTKSSDYTWHPDPVGFSEVQLRRYKRDDRGRLYTTQDLTAERSNSASGKFEWRGTMPPPSRGWGYSLEQLEEWWKQGRIATKRDGTPRMDGLIVYLDEKQGQFPQSIWSDTPRIANTSPERLGYNTQKPEALLERIIKASSNEGDLVADFFCGSGTTMAVAEKLGRRWIGVDLGRYSIHTTRKRLIQVQRELHAKGQPYRSFDVYNLGRYERQWWQLDRLRGADEQHRCIVLRFYKAAPLNTAPHPLLHGTRHGAYVHVDQIDGIFTYNELRAVAEAARAAGGRELHCLAWEFEMELALKKQAVEAETGLTIRLKYIPREIMEPNRTEAQFFEAGYLEARVIWNAQAMLARSGLEHGSSNPRAGVARSGLEPGSSNPKVDVELMRFAPSLAEAPEKEMAALRERAISSPFDFIDFWAVDFTWHEGKPFEHHWQDFRTRKDRSLKICTDIGWQYADRGKHQICVKVIDVFGVDTTTVIDVET